jgi:hypothetical protein
MFDNCKWQFYFFLAFQRDFSVTPAGFQRDFSGISVGCQRDFSVMRV